MREVGLGDLRLELNTIGDSKCRPAYLERLRDYYRPLKEKLSPDSQQRLERNPLRLLDSKSEQDAPFKSSAPQITDHLCDECAAHWALVRRLLDSAEIEYTLNPYLVRGLDYYTRTVFEFFPSGAAGQQDALGGGGRYDGLAEAELMAASGVDVIARPTADVLVVPDGDLAVEAAEVARICRAVRSTAVDYESKSLTAKMRAANKLGAKWVVLLTPDAASRRSAQLRDMTSGEQEELEWVELPTRLA